MQVDSNSKSARLRNSGCRITENIFFGEIPALVLENELLRLTILAGRGADVVECLYKKRDLDLVWLTQWGIPTKQVPLDHPADVESFLQGYPGGWQSIFPNGGAPSTYEGIDYGQHDEIALLPWDYEILQDNPEQIEVRFSVKTRKSRFHATKTFLLKSNSASAKITEEIESLADVEQSTMWGFHISFGAPFLDQSSVIELPNAVEVLAHPEAIADTGRRVATTKSFTWPSTEGEDGLPVDFSKLPAPGSNSEMLYLTGFDQGWYRVLNPNLRVAMKFKWDLSVMPYLWYWQEFGSSSAYPWFGRHYNIGLEPFSSYPTNGLAQAVANGSALRFAPREKKTSVIEFEVSEV